MFTGKLAVWSTIAIAPWSLCAAMSAVAAASGPLTFDQRVEAQAAIDRIRHEHVIGSKRPFEEVHTRAALEAKVLDSLRLSVALDVVWKTPLTVEALERELDRMVRDTRSPERLHEIFDALNNDRHLILECFVRPVLAERMTRNFAAADPRFQSAAKRAAQQLAASLRAGGRSSTLDDGRPVTVLEIVRDPGIPSTVVQAVAGSTLSTAPPADRAMFSAGNGLAVPDEEYRRLRAEAPARPGDVIVRDNADAFVVVKLASDEESRFRIEAHAVPKKGWKDIWAVLAGGLDAWKPIDLVASGNASTLPNPHASTPGALVSRTSARIDSPCVSDFWDPALLGDAGRERTGHTAIWTGTHMIVWGGSRFLYWLGVGASYDPIIDSWTPLSTAGAPLARENHTAVWTGHEMIVWGGRNDFDALQTGGRYDPETDTWHPIATADAPLAREKHAAVWTGTEMIVWGGQDGATRFIDGGRYDPNSDTWIPISLSGAPSPREEFSAVWTGQQLVIWGGIGRSGAYLTSGARYEPNSDIWLPTSLESAPEARYGHSAVWTGSRMLIWGGRAPSATNRLLGDGYEYDPQADAWTRMSGANEPPPRLHHQAIWTGTVMLVWGGERDYDVPNLGGRYDPVAREWTPIATEGAPEDRSGISAVWTGDQMLIWGGRDYFTWFRSGARYRPQDDSWVPITMPYNPGARTGHTALWTGNEMLVWGGRGHDGDEGSGGRYDPVTDLWVPLSTSGAPRPRSLHTAVWTGIEMIVWGGDHYTYDDETLNDGGRYTPSTDSWAPTASAGAPSPRFLHTGVWDGTEMIVWGGLYEEGNTSEILRTGGRYDPATDTWRETSAQGSPEKRYSHGAVWTGTEMIVFGGSTSVYGQALVTGGRYRPDTDSWLPTALVNAPSNPGTADAVWTGNEMMVWISGYSSPSAARYDPGQNVWSPISLEDIPYLGEGSTAIWDGTHLVVWGGDSSYQSGSRYDPVRDLWTATTPSGAPPGKRRVGATSVWTGERMLVWGGASEGQLQSDGGSYWPGLDPDHDGAFAPCDVCPTLSDDQRDFDGDGTGDACDYDDDADGVPDLLDNCRLAANTAQEDRDGDGVGDACDNCVSAPNTAQTDKDSDGIGDICDNCRAVSNQAQDDGDTDGVGDACDNCAQVANADQADPDGDGSGSVCDNCPDVVNHLQEDVDSDGIGDVCDFTLLLPRTMSYFGWNSEIPTFTWAPGNLSLFRLEFSTDPRFKKKVIRSSKKFNPGTAYTPAERWWPRILRLGGSNYRPVYWRVVGKVPGSPVKVFSDQTFIIYIYLP